jgi:hypothetical protein
MTTNGADEIWVGTLTLTVMLSDAEKQCLEAIKLLGSFSVGANDTNYPDAIESLLEREFLSRERQGETFFRGRSRGDGSDIYTITELGRLWLQDCRRVEPSPELGEPTEMAGAVVPPVTINRPEGGRP